MTVNSLHDSHGPVRPAATDARTARAALTRLMEPSDLTGMALVRATGPVEALALIRNGASSSATVEREMTAILAASGISRWPGLADALTRWRPRLPDLAPERDLAMIRRLGGGLVIPEDDAWPAALADLELAEPLALWMRGTTPVIPGRARCIAVVGSRDSTSYGANVTGEMAAGLVQHGFTMVSGGAYGIDAQAHRGALSTVRAGMVPTIAVMAGGLDRYYPCLLYTSDAADE